MFTIKRFGAMAAVLGLVAIGVTAMPGKADAWWRGGWCCGVGIGVVVPPIVVAPAPAAYYAPPPQGTGIPGHYEGRYGVPGHWA